MVWSDTRHVHEQNVQAPVQAQIYNVSMTCQPKLTWSDIVIISLDECVKVANNSRAMSLLTGKPIIHKKYSFINQGDNSDVSMQIFPIISLSVNLNTAYTCT